MDARDQMLIQVVGACMRRLPFGWISLFVTGLVHSTRVDEGRYSICGLSLNRETGNILLLLDTSPAISSKPRTNLFQQRLRICRLRWLITELHMETVYIPSRL